MADPQKRKLSKLEAVNIVLRGAREHPVSSLDDDATNETLVAEQVIDEWNLDLQALGLHNNTFEQTLTAATAASTGINVGDVVLPPNTMSVRSWGTDLDWKVDAREDEGNLKLYDLEDETFDFSTKTEITLLLMLFLNFDDLTALQQRAIADQAAHEYQMFVVGSSTMNDILSARARRSRAQARSENIRKMRPNIFTNARSNLAASAARAVVRRWWAQGTGRRLYNRRVIN
jgi:hypothetical protein